MPEARSRAAGVSSQCDGGRLPPIPDRMAYSPLIRGALGNRMATVTGEHSGPVRRRPPRRGSHGPLTLPLAVFAAVVLLALVYIGYVVWPRWPRPPVGPHAPP